MNHIIASMLVCALFLLQGMTPGRESLLRNGDFEKFTGNEPDGWTTTNIPKILTVVSPSTQCHSGKYAVRCDVKDFYGSKVAGMIIQKGVAIRGSSLTLSGFYLLHSTGGDAGFISLELQSAEGNTVKICQENLTNPAASFTRFTMTGDVPAGAVLLDIKLTILAGAGSEKLHEGTFIVFDALELVPAVNG